VSDIRFPVSTLQLQEYLPHRPPMVWVDEVIHCGVGPNGLLSGTCKVKLSGDRHFFSANGTIRASALIEWIAQSYGFAKACQQYALSDQAVGLRKAYLVGITECEVNISGIEEEDAVLVQIEESHALVPAYIVDGKVTSADGQKIFGTARIKTFAEV
jgi:predicted hotdog family 3-hydroxylacyl-ACP dehydratase